MKKSKNKLMQALQSKFWLKPRKHPFVASAFLSVFLFFMACFSLVIVNAQTVGPDDIKVVDIYESGILRVVPTRASTVKEFLEKQDIAVNDFDIVEPNLEAQIESEDFVVSVFRAKPVSVTEGSETKRLVSARQDPRLIANEAGYNLSKSDKAEWAEDSGIEISRRIVVSRSKAYQVNLYGNIFTHNSHLVEPNEILTEAGVELAEGDSVLVSAPLESSHESAITVSRQGTKIEAATEVIKFKTVSTNDSSLAAGKKEVDVEGVDGQRTLITETNLETGVKTVIQDIVTKEPVNKEQRVGTKIPTVSNNVSADKQFLMAAAGIPESDWGYVDFIITKESTWNAGARNPIGCIGLGQNCPNSSGYYWLIDACPDWQYDPVCQLGRFQGYAFSRYGSWGQAYAFWLSNGWW